MHYQTIYRWVRGGRLAAALVNGRYVVDPSDLEEFDELRRAPRQPAPPGRARLDRSAERMYRALVSGDEPSATALAQRLVDDGTPIVDLIQDMLVPSLRRIGEEWRAGDLTVWVEHRASAIAERIVGALVPNPRGRRRGTAVVAAVSGDRHTLPTTMAVVALRGDNWNVQHLGGDMPADEIVRFCDEHDVTVAVLTVTNPDVAELAAVTADRLRAHGTPTIVGGAGRTLHELVALARTASTSPS